MRKKNAQLHWSYQTWTFPCLKLQLKLHLVRLKWRKSMEKMESYLYSLTDIQWSQRDDKRNIRNWKFNEIFSFKAYQEIDITDLRWVLSYVTRNFAQQIFTQHIITSFTGQRGWVVWAWDLKARDTAFTSLLWTLAWLSLLVPGSTPSMSTANWSASCQLKFFICWVCLSHMVTSELVEGTG